MGISKRTIATIVFVIFIVAIIGLFTYQIKTNEVLNEGWHKIYSTFGLVFSLYTFFIGVIIFLESNNPSKTIAWLLVLFLVPVVGFIFYIVFGQNLRKRKTFKDKKNKDFIHLNNMVNTQKELLQEIDFFTNDDSLVKSRLINLLLRNSDSPFTINNDVEVLTNGKATYDSIISQLKMAKHHIHMEYFIIRDDTIGNIVREILIDKVKSGIEVRLIYDSVGSWRLSKGYINSLKEAGVKVFPFYPVIFPVLSRELNYRNHRKLIIIDGRVGYLGGLNIGDEYLGKNTKLGFWRDTHIKIEGEAIYTLQNIFLQDWKFVSKESIENQDYFPKLSYYGEKLIQITPSGPDSNWQSILQAYFTMISTAEEKIWITTPYLVPDESITMALKTAALSGVDVRIIIPSKPDHLLVFWASRANIEELLEAGVRIFTYEEGFIHSKILLVDGIGASIGTANLDMRSLKINFEVNAFIYDSEVVDRLERDFIKDEEASKEILLEEFTERSIFSKFLESLGQLLSPLL